jgi:hypothetical protein
MNAEDDIEIEYSPSMTHLVGRRPLQLARLRGLKRYRSDEFKATAITKSRKVIVFRFMGISIVEYSP